MSPENIETDIFTKTENLANQITSWRENNTLENMVQERRQQLETALETEEWKHLFPGRKILKKLAREIQMRYIHFRNQIINKIHMKDRIPPKSRIPLKQFCASHDLKRIKEKVR